MQAAGHAQPSFVANLVEEAEKAGRLQEEEEEIIYTAGVIYVGEFLDYGRYVPTSDTDIPKVQRIL